MTKLFILFLTVPLVEIYFLIQIGDVIGAGFTIFMVVLTALIGAALVRYQGVTTLARAQKELIKNRMPAMEVIEGAFLLLAGALLLTPGFVTDALGFLLLVSPLRQNLIRRFLQARVVPDVHYREDDGPGGKRVIDIEYKDSD